MLLVIYIVFIINGYIFIKPFYIHINIVLLYIWFLSCNITSILFSTYTISILLLYINIIGSIYYK